MSRAVHKKEAPSVEQRRLIMSKKWQLTRVMRRAYCGGGKHRREGKSPTTQFCLHCKTDGAERQVPSPRMSRSTRLSPFHLHKYVLWLTHTPPNVYALMQSPFLWLARANLEPSGELSNLSKATLCDTQAPSRILVKIGTPTPKLREPGCRMALVQGGLHASTHQSYGRFFLPLTAGSRLSRWAGRGRCDRWTLVEMNMYIGCRVSPLCRIQVRSFACGLSPPVV
jgi:hypothetical protein